MTDAPNKTSEPLSAAESLRQKIENGGNLLVDKLTDDELVAMHDLILQGKAEIVSLACKPYLSARRERLIISH